MSPRLAAPQHGPGIIVQVAETESPVGRLAVAVHKGTLLLLEFRPDWKRIIARLESRLGPVALDRVKDPGAIVAKLTRYFEGDLAIIDTITVETGGTPFQRAVWEQLRLIPLGQTRSYSELARAVGDPKAVRAVGAANGANPIAIVVPCHRAIGADGRLVGYGGGLRAKEWLLRHEGALL